MCRRVLRRSRPGRRSGQRLHFGRIWSLDPAKEALLHLVPDFFLDNGFRFLSRCPFSASIRLFTLRPVDAGSRGRCCNGPVLTVSVVPSTSEEETERALAPLDSDLGTVRERRIRREEWRRNNRCGVLGGRLRGRSRSLPRARGSGGNSTSRWSHVWGLRGSTRGRFAWRRGRHATVRGWHFAEFSCGGAGGVHFCRKCGIAGRRRRLERRGRDAMSLGRRRTGRPGLRSWRR